MSSSSEPNRPANRLIHETSPYLRQHAHNPVDWYPWGDEALTRAKTEGKPIFLSIGYSACHWCHVMEHESFEDPSIAALMNEHFINIKVDREERPDLDQIYMAAVQLITRRGGWPMSVFLTPDGKPFYGGTYWPPTSRLGMRGFREILLLMHDFWVNRRPEVVESSESLVGAIGRFTSPAFEQTELDEVMLRRAEQELLSSLDRVHGGSAVPPSSRTRWTCGCSCEPGNDSATPQLSKLSCSLSRRWLRAGSMIIWAAGFTATRPMRTGWCRTSRRCCTTTRCWSRFYLEAYQRRARGLPADRPRDAGLRAARDDLT